MFPNVITCLDRTFKEEQNYVNFKFNYFIKLVYILISFAESVMRKQLKKMHHALTHALIR